MIRSIKPGWWHSRRGSANWGGSMARTFTSTCAGPPPTPNAGANLRRNWYPSRRTSFWFPAAHRLDRCCRRPAQYRSIAGKWLELLKEITPDVTRVAVIRDPLTAAGVGQLAAIQAVAQSLRIDLVPINFRDPDQLEHAIASFARPASALLIAQSSGTGVHRKLLVALAAKHRLPAIYPATHFVTAGGLMAYAPDLVDEYRQAAGTRPGGHSSMSKTSSIRAIGHQPMATTIFHRASRARFA
jgi:ABC transporter substrate binding protein